MYTRWGATTPSGRGWSSHDRARRRLCGGSATSTRPRGSRGRARPVPLDLRRRRSRTLRTCSTPATPPRARTSRPTRSGTTDPRRSTCPCRCGPCSSGACRRWPASRAGRRSTSTRSTRWRSATASSRGCTISQHPARPRVERRSRHRRPHPGPRRQRQRQRQQPGAERRHSRFERARSPPLDADQPVVDCSVTIFEFVALSVELAKC